jgi:quercetin dioxygenase-like cupin family protein
MLKASVYQSGKLWGAVYEFSAPGDVVPAHKHDKENDYHNVVCLLGRVRIPELDIILEAGEVADIDCTKEHSVVALIPSKTLHICINGKPSFADYL